MPSPLSPHSARPPEQSASLLTWWLENPLKSFTRGREKEKLGWVKEVDTKGAFGVPLLDLGDGYTGVFILSLFTWLNNCNGNTFYIHITLQLFKVYF